ncbi:MAG: THUMP domain-containing protein [Candidatus Hodarchaeales archaeon]|jgi:tRNA acetyltransferase TAN1
MSFLISSQRTSERDAISELFYVISDLYNHELKIHRSRVPGLSLLQLKDTTTGPFEVLSQVKEYIKDKGPLIACLKIVPLEKLIKTEISSIITNAKQLAESKIQNSDTWRITVNKRQTNLHTQEVVEAIADEINWGTVKLKNPDFEVRIEIVRDLTGISVMNPKTIIRMMKINTTDDYLS